LPAFIPRSSVADLHALLFSERPPFYLRWHDGRSLIGRADSPVMYAYIRLGSVRWRLSNLCPWKAILSPVGGMGGPCRLW
jgi:hypothetical protein